MPTIRGARYRLSQTMKKFAERVYTVPGGEIYDIGQDRLGPNAKRALIVYTIQAIPYLLAGDVQKCPIINEHTMYWESAEMVRLLNEHGYVVDYYDIHSRTPINWSKYQLVIDERNNLVHAPNAADLTKIFYCTGNHWLFQNMAELGRIKDFHRRHGVFVAPERQFPAVFTDEVADYMTYFGTPFQLQLFHPASHKHQLNISAVFTPPHQTKNVAQAKRNFLWLGSGGLLLKGLDLAVEAFSQMPDLHLYIAGNAEREPRFWSWLKPMFDKHPNLHYLGWMDVASREFSDVANKCIGTVYVSSTEGGPGSIAQLVHFGLIPVATETSAVRTAEALGHVIRSQEPAVIIDELKARVQALVALPDAELLAQSEQVRAFASQNHTREAYSRSFRGLLERVAERR